MSILDRSEILNLIGMENAILRDKIVDQESLFEKKLAEAIDSILLKIEISRKQQIDQNKADQEKISQLGNQLAEFTRNVVVDTRKRTQLTLAVETITKELSSVKQDVNEIKIQVADLKDNIGKTRN